MNLNSRFLIVLAAIGYSVGSLSSSSAPAVKKDQANLEETAKVYKKKYQGTQLIESYDVPGTDDTKDGKFYVTDNDFLITGFNERSSDLASVPVWFKEGEKSWREVPVDMLNDYGFNKGDRVSYFSFGEDKVKEFILKDKVNINMIQSFFFGENPAFYRSFYINLMDKGSESDRTKKASQVDSPTGLAYIGEKLKLTSTKFIHPKVFEAKLDDPIPSKVLDAYNYELSKRGHLISPKKVFINEYGSFYLVSLQDEGGREIAAVGVLSENKFVDLTDFSHGENGSLLRGVGGFIQDGLILVFRQDGMHSCYVLVVIRNGEVMIYRPDCDLTGGC